MKDGKADSNGDVILARLTITDLVRDGERKILVESAELDTHEQVMSLTARALQEVLKARPGISIYGETKPHGRRIGL